MLVTCPNCEHRFMVTTYEPGRDVDAFVIKCIDVRGFSLRTVAELLIDQEVPTPRGNTTWHATTVKRFYEQAVKRSREFHGT